MVMGGVDATKLNETPLAVQETIGEELVEVRQIDNTVEAKAPWKDQEGITIQYDMGEPSLVEKFMDERTEQVIYDRVDFGDGGFKIDVLLTEKPDTNSFCYTIEGAENYDFFYQPPLTAEEIAEGAFRPPEIEGSYAVYHKTLKNHVIGQENYATGKVMHIPRPQVWEIGNEEKTKRWADLSYENGQLCVTAPQDFIDNADYTNGVRIDPTFGYTTAGGTSLALGVTGNGAIFKSTLSEIGLLTRINIYMTGGSSVGGTPKFFKCVIYNDSSGSPGTRNSTSSEYGHENYTTVDWISCPISTQLSSADYWLGVLRGSGSNTSNRYDAGGSSGQTRTDTGIDYASGGDSSWDDAGDTHLDHLFSIYAIYVLAPSVTTVGATPSAVNAIITGTTTNDEYTLTNTGFVYGLTSDLSGADTATTSAGVAISFRALLNGLQPGTTYYYRAYSENPLGRTYGSILSFTTTNDTKTQRINNGTIRINNGRLDI